VKPPPFEYAAPESLSEAIELLAGDPEAKVLAGGQSLVPLLNFRLATPSQLVDLRRVPGLDRITREDGRVRLGAMVRQRQAEESAVVAGASPLLAEALGHVAHPQIRSRGTVGGSIAHADPAAELPAVLVALAGRVRAVGPSGTRWIDAADLFDTFFTTSLARDEVLTEVDLPAAPAGSGAACVEIARRAGDYAVCGAVAQVTPEGDGSVAEARIALFGVGRKPQRAFASEEVLRGEHASRERVEEAASAASEDVSPPDDLQGSSAYRRHLARVVARRALERALERSR
jgi:carbon-monoxide dehydrogenase medium subunit